MRDSRPDVRHLLQTFFVRGHDPFQAAEHFGDLACGRFADQADAERGQEARQGRGLAAFQGIDQVLGGFVGQPVQCGELLFRERVQVARVVHETAFHELVDDLAAQPVDVHRAAVGEEAQALLELGRAGEAGAAVGRFAFLARHDGAADRAFGRHLEDALVAGARVRDRLDDVGDHVAGALHDDRVADAYVLARDFVHVVQRGVLDRHPADGHRIELGDRGERAGPADVGHDGADARRGLHGRELVGRGPARRPRNLSQPGLQVEPVHLDHGSVDLEGQAVALPFQRGDRGRHVRHVWADAGVRHGFQPPAGQRATQVPIGRGNGAFDCAHAVAEEVERPGRGDGRVELFERARGGVARVGEQRFFGPGAPVVQLPERGFGKEDFAAHFEPRRRRVRPLGEQGQRNRAHGLQVGGDVFARDAVPARRADGERAVRIDQFHGHAVDLGLGHVLDRAVRFQEAEHALVKLLHLLLGGDVAERQHGQAVPHLAELGQRRGADFPGG